jgi:hypothetical protein
LRADARVNALTIQQIRQADIRAVLRATRYLGARINSFERFPDRLVSIMFVRSFMILHRKAQLPGSGYPSTVRQSRSHAGSFAAAANTLLSQFKCFPRIDLTFANSL